MRSMTLCTLAALALSACSGEYRSSPSGVDASSLSVPDSGRAGVAAQSVQQENCTLTQGFWKNHEEAWPVEELILGATTYTKAQSAHQLIAAKLNVVNGADPTAIATTLADADAWLIAHPLGSSPKGAERAAGIALAEMLDDFNNGVIGPGHCGGPTPTPTPPPA